MPERLTLHLPEPPSLNDMLSLAMKRTRRTRNGGFMKKAVPGIVYDQAHDNYDTMALAELRTQGVDAPRTPWALWRIESMDFRLWGLRDWGELMASCKWPIDFLVKRRFVKNDSPRELARPPVPTQRVDRQHRGVTLVIAEGWPLVLPEQDNRRGT